MSWKQQCSKLISSAPHRTVHPEFPTLVKTPNDVREGFFRGFTNSQISRTKGIQLSMQCGLPPSPEIINWSKCK